MAIEGVNDPCARAFWFLTALVSVIGLSTYVGDLHNAGASFQAQMIFHAVKGVVIGLTICFTLQMIGYMFLWDRPTRTYKTGPFVLTIFQMCLLAATYFLSYKYPTAKALVFTVLVITGGIGTAQLVRPAEDFDVCRALLTIFLGFCMGYFGFSFDPERDFMLVWIPRSVPCVLMIIFTNFAEKLRVLMN